MRLRPILILAAAIGLSACASTGLNPAAHGVMRFTGTVSAIDQSCFFDGTCTATVNGIVVTTMSGERLGNPVWGQPNNLPQVGQRVDVHCAKTSEKTCTLKGSTGYFIRPASR